MKYLLNRLKEPTTWAGVSALGLLFGIPPGTVEVVVQAVVAVSAAAAVLMPGK
jgi:hypothetical protein